MADNGSHDRLSPAERRDVDAALAQRVEDAKARWSRLLDEAQAEAALAVETLGTPESQAHATRCAELTDEFKRALAEFTDEVSHLR